MVELIREVRCEENEELQPRDVQEREGALTSNNSLGFCGVSFSFFLMPCLVPLPAAFFSSPLIPPVHVPSLYHLSLCCVSAPLPL
jgi:hypothetical protein